MSQIVGNLPAPTITGANQSPTGVGKFTLEIPMGFDTKGGSPFPRPSPIPSYPGYSYTNAVGKKNAGGNWVWEVTYEGKAFLGDPNAKDPNDNAVYAFEPADLEFDIKLHPDWLAWMNQYGGSTDKSTGKTTFTPPAGATGQNTVSGPLTDNIVDLGSLDSYTSFAGLWSKSYSMSDALPPDLYIGVEQIVLTVPQPSWLRLPSFGKRNWLKMQPIISAKGRSVEIKERYMISGRKGWNTLVYNGSGQ